MRGVRKQDGSGSPPGGLGLKALYLVYYGAGAAWSPLLNVYLQQMGLSGLQIGTLSGIRPAVGILAKPLWGVVADTWGRRRTLLLLLPISAALIVGFLWNGGF